MDFRIGKIIASCLISGVYYLIKSIFVIPRGNCRHFPSCSDYAQEAIEILPAHLALFKILKRILRCNPFFKGGYDPVIKEG